MAEVANPWTEFVGLNAEIKCTVDSTCKGMDMKGKYMFETDAEGVSSFKIQAEVNLPEGKSYKKNP